MTRIKRPFTLLEVIIVLLLITLSMGAIGWKAHVVLEKRRFQSDLAQLKSRLQMIHRMAMHAQADWHAHLKCEKSKWFLESAPAEKTRSPFKPLLLHSFDLKLNGKPVEMVSMEFFSTGEVFPHASFIFRQGSREEKWELPQLFKQDAGDGIKNLGPIHPEEI